MSPRPSSPTVQRMRSRAVQGVQKLQDTAGPALGVSEKPFAATMLSDVLRANAESVLADLTGAGVPHRLAGVTRDDHFLVGVPETHARAAVAALVDGRGRVSIARGAGRREVRDADDLPADFAQRAGTDLLVAGHKTGWLPSGSAMSRAACVVRFGENPSLDPVAGSVEAADATPLAPSVPFPVDIVYTWVDDADSAWLERKHRALEAVAGHELNFAATAAGRYKNRDELKFSLRSVWQFAPWVNHIYIVTDDQHPTWLDPKHPKVDVVSHREIFDPDDALPVFNSHAIECQLHHVDGLSEHYLYMNDDFLFSRPVTPDLFFHSNGIAKFFPSQAQIPLGEPTVDDAPVDAAAKNVRALVREAFGRTVTQKFKHTPQPQHRSVLYEMEKRFPEEFHRTARSRFRQHSDISVPSAFQHHYAYLSARAVEGSIAYRYIGLDDHDPSMTKMARLLDRRDADCYCVNDADVPDADVAWADETLANFLSRYYPFPSEYETS